MVLRLLILFLFAYLIFLLVYSFLSGRGRRKGGVEGQSKSAEEMVLDPQCQSYVPKGEAFLQQGHYFCSEECAQKYLSR